MTREEMQAVVETVLDAPRTEPGRLDTIMRAADAYAFARYAYTLAEDAWADRPARVSRPVHLLTAALTFACGHDGQDPGSYQVAKVTCPACLETRTP
jgi:hypothetical protein